MSRKLVAACIAVLALPHAAHAVGQQVFVNGTVGLSDSHIGNGGADRDGSDVAAAIRVGVLWRGQPQFGIETGYADLGRYRQRIMIGQVQVRDQVHTRAALLGANVTYRFDAPWYVTARGGLLRSWLSVHEYADGVASGQGSAAGNGWYLGAGGGYDISEQLSIGAHLDLYHVAASQGAAQVDGHVATLGVQLEYRY
ncbi:outer membrane protein [Dyella sp.]|jgi:OOP family OmpA-OmpF porin|uniref:outer membrane protein n=1 Tax=Dyella sp. TaxID=1869338 RepID=UPI002D792F29|nr:outer membrane beta-barrel protein [Dyella sp.]HET6434058.1 outer membrane beta-barrel protein [Dyella sp.]